MSRHSNRGRPVIFWAICPECLTYIWVDESSVAGEDTVSCPYCEIPIPLLGGKEVAASCRRVSSMLEEIERQIRSLPAALDVHRFLKEEVDCIAGAFNDRLDEFQASKDLGNPGPDSIKAKQAS